MTEVINVSSKRAHPIRLMSRIIGLIIGVSLPVMLIEYPPVKPTWLAMGTILSIVLALFSIFGLWPRLRITFLGHVLNNKVVHTTTFFLIGMIIITLSFVNQEVSGTWLAFFMLVGALLVLDAITSITYIVKSKKQELSQAPQLHGQHHKLA